MMCPPKSRSIINVFVFVLLFSMSLSAMASLTERQTVEFADAWYIEETERNSRRLSREFRQEHPMKIEHRRISYLREDGTHSTKDNGDKKVVAYVISYQPAGYVVVSAAERDDFNPILAFNIEDDFHWRAPEKDAFAFMVSREANSRLSRERFTAAKTISVPKDAVRLRLKRYIAAKKTAIRKKLVPPTPPWDVLEQAPLTTSGTLLSGTNTWSEWRWDTANWNQDAPYNAKAVEECGGKNVFAGCVAAAMAIKLRFHKWPAEGSGTPPKYTDKVDGDSYQHWSDISNHTYNWERMPATSITTPNDHVAELMYDCGVSVKMNYGLDGSSADKVKTNGALADYFGYTRGVTTDSSTLADHLGRIKKSVKMGLPVIAGPNGHALVVSGYRSDDYFWVNNGWGSEAWLLLSELPGKDDKDGIGPVDESITFQQPTNYVYVDTGNNNGNGRAWDPYNTLQTAVQNVSSNSSQPGHVWIQNGDYEGSSLTIQKDVDIRSYGGRADVNGRLLLNSHPDRDTLDSVAQISVRNGGVLVIE